nr:MAG TPA: hypothetical protein [Caudoviricetes sp.]
MSILTSIFEFPANISLKEKSEVVTYVTELYCVVL